MTDKPTKRPIRLTKAQVDKLQPREKPYFVYDKDLKGFSVRVSPTGTKTWQFEYRPYPGGRGVAMRRMSLGNTTKMTPEKARKEAETNLAKVRLRENPAQDRIEKRKEMRVSALIDLYEREGCVVQRGERQGEPMKPRTKAYTLARLRHHAVPLLGKKLITEVATRDTEKMFRDIEAGKTARDEVVDGRRVIVRGGPGAARKVFRDLSAVFTFAVGEQLVPDNPCKNARVSKTDKKRERYLKPDELTRLGKAFDTLEEQGINPKALNIARLWALTGCRRDEIAGLKWSEVDFEYACLSLEDSKTGKSHRPLASAALMLLSSIPKEAGSPYVFPATSGTGFFQGTKRIWPKVVELAKLPGVTPHTLRHTMGSTAISSDLTMAMTGAILGHSNMSSTQRYAHVQNDPARRAAERAVSTIAAALEGKETVRPTPIRRGGR